MAEPVLRRATPADVPALSAIWFAASMQAHGFLGAERLAAQRRLVEEVYLPRAETWLACGPAPSGLGRAPLATGNGTAQADPRLPRPAPVDAPIPLGFISLLGHFVGALFVDPAAQGRGIGSRLIAQARALRGDLVLEVYTANPRALHFYAAQGFRETARKPVDAGGLPFETARLVLG